MKADKAIRMLERRIEWLERKCLPARLVGKPWGTGESEIRACELAIKALLVYEVQK